MNTNPESVTLSATARAYLVCALWSSVNDFGDPMDDTYSSEDFSDTAKQRAQTDCTKFETEQASDIANAHLDSVQIGHSFWLNHNGHGAGFWDIYSQTTCPNYEREQASAVLTRDFSKRDSLDATCDCPYHACRRLSDAAEKFRALNLYVTDAGEIDFE